MTRSYLIHQPWFAQTDEEIQTAWAQMEAIQAKGLAKSIGVSNYTPAHLNALLKTAKVVPACNQIEFHPWNQQREILAYCQKKGIVVTAYSPLTQGKRLGDATIVRIAQKLGKTPAQVVLRWCLQKGVSVIPKSDRDERINENKNLYDFELDEDDMKAIDALDEGQKGNQGEWDPFAWEA